MAHRIAVGHDPVGLHRIVARHDPVRPAISGGFPVIRHEARPAVPTLRTMADEGAPEPEPDLDLDIDPADDSSAVMAAVGRQIKLWREAAGWHGRRSSGGSR
ncbi:hypothetical protein [Streptomyces anulatus]|uniref:hypothetical protein n=1 Tax=Streptomyces anulatus TaxID=1892 RepID=UPI0033F4A09B